MTMMLTIDSQKMHHPISMRLSPVCRSRRFQDIFYQ